MGALNRHRAIEVTCDVESLQDQRWKAKLYGEDREWPAKSTKNEGLSVGVHYQRSDGGAMHNGYPLFRAEVAAHHMIRDLLRGTPQWADFDTTVGLRSTPS